MDRAHIVEQFLERLRPHRTVILGNDQEFAVGSFLFLKVILDTHEAQDPGENDHQERAAKCPDDCAGHETIFPVAEPHDRYTGTKSHEDRQKLDKHENALDK